MTLCIAGFPLGSLARLDPYYLNGSCCSIAGIGHEDRGELTRVCMTNPPIYYLEICTLGPTSQQRRFDLGDEFKDYSEL